MIQQKLCNRTFIAGFQPNRWQGGCLIQITLYLSPSKPAMRHAAVGRVYINAKGSRTTLITITHIYYKFLSYYALKMLYPVNHFTNNVRSSTFLSTGKLL